MMKQMKVDWKFIITLGFLLMVNIFLPMALTISRRLVIPHNYSLYADLFTFIGSLYLILLCQQNHIEDRFQIDSSLKPLILIAWIVLIIVSSKISILAMFCFFGLSLYLIRDINKIWKNETRPGAPSLVLARNLFWGLVIGGIIYLLRPYNIATVKPLNQFWMKLFVEFGKAAVNEEILIRGFLWGFLISLGLKEKVILFLQALIFSMAHVKYYGNIYIMLMIFIVGIILGLSVWKFRSLSPAIIGHALANTLTYFF